MRKFLIFLIALLMIGSAAALPMFGPTQGFRNPGNVEIGGTLSIGGASITAGAVSYDALRAEIVVNETAINSSIDTLTMAAFTNETAINTSIAALTIAAFTNETAINTTAGNVAVAQTAQNNTLGNLAIGQTRQNTTLTNLALAQTAQNNTAGNVALGQIAQNTSIANTALGQTWQNNSITNLGAANTVQNTTAGNVALGQTTQNNSITNLQAGNTAQNASIAAKSVLSNTNDTAINSTLTANKESDYLNTTAINSSIAALELPIASIEYDANSVDQGVFTAKGQWTLTGVRMTPRVVGSNGGAVNVMVKLCDSGEAPTAGDDMLSGTLDLKGTADTPQSGTLSAVVTIGTGKIVALDFTGTLTDAVGTITLYGTRG